MGGQKSGGETVTTTRPPDYLAPYLTEAAKEAQNLYYSGGVPVYPGQRLADQSPATLGAQDYLSQLIMGQPMPSMPSPQPQPGTGTQPQTPSLPPVAPPGSPPPVVTDPTVVGQEPVTGKDVLGYDSQLQALYMDLLGREADESGLAGYNQWLNRGKTIEDVRQDIIGSAEFASPERTQRMRDLAMARTQTPQAAAPQAMLRGTPSAFAGKNAPTTGIPKQGFASMASPPPGGAPTNMVPGLTPASTAPEHAMAMSRRPSGFTGTIPGSAGGKPGAIDFNPNLPGGQLTQDLGMIRESLSNVLQGPQNIASNPVIADVVQAAQRPIYDQLSEQTLPQISRDAVGAGQFGGSRQGIAEGLASGKASRAAADASAQIYGQFLGEAQRAQTQALGMSPQLQQLQTMPAQLMAQLGQQQEARSQQELDAARNYWMEQAGQPMNNLQTFIANLTGQGGVSSSGGQSMMGGAPQQSGAGKLLGGGLAGLGTYGMLAMNPVTAPFALAGGLMGGLSGVL